MEMELKISGGCIAVLEALFIGGVAYNAFVAWLEREGRDRGFTALLVVIGVLITLVGYACIIGIKHALLAFFCFAASGTPMIIGSVWRYSQHRRQAESTAESAAIEALDD